MEVLAVAGGTRGGVHHFLFGGRGFFLMVNLDGVKSGGGGVVGAEVGVEGVRFHLV